MNTWGVPDAGGGVSQALYDAALADIEALEAELADAGWREVGQLDFRTMTPTVIAAGGTTVDGVTFANTAFPAQSPLSASIALTISALGLQATGADGSANRSVDIALANFCDEVLDPGFSYAFTVEVSGPIQASDTYMAMIGDGVTQMMGAGLSETAAIGWQLVNAAFGGTVSVAHGGTIRQIGMVVSPGARTGTLSFTATASPGEAQKPSEFASPVFAVSHGTINTAAVADLDNLFMFLTPATAYLQRITIWTDKPVAP